MKYPVYVHSGDEAHAWGAIVPDVPGCFAAADREEDLPAAVQEALELYFDDEQLELPEPSSLKQLMADEQYQGGAWMLVDIDTTRIQGPARRINMTVPERALREIDAAAHASHQSRSAYMTRASLWYTRTLRGETTGK